MKLYEKVFGCTWKKHNRTAQVSTSLSVASMLPHPSMNDTPSHFEQNAVLPHPVHSFHVLIFHFREQINTWRMYGVIAEGFDHSLDHLDTWKPFAFSHTNKCLLATDSLRHLVRWGNTMLPHQVPYRDLGVSPFKSDRKCTCICALLNEIDTHTLESYNNNRFMLTIGIVRMNILPLHIPNYLYISWNVSTIFQSTKITEGGKILFRDNQGPSYLPLDCHGCWWPRDTRNQVIKNYTIEGVELE